MVGADPSFSDVHLLRAIIAIGRKPVGRKKLVRILGVGEGSVRTILKKLGEEELIVSSKQGHRLSPKGEGFLKKRLSKFTVPKETEIEWLNGFKSFIVVHGASGKIGTGMVERDTALIAGADGAVILTYGKGKLSFPADISIRDYKDVSSTIDNLKEKDVVVISFGKTQIMAENGALAVALELSD